MSDEQNAEQHVEVFFELFHYLIFIHVRYGVSLRNEPHAVWVCPFLTVLLRLLLDLVTRSICHSWPITL